jgi:hypothetical protein
MFLEKFAPASPHAGVRESSIRATGQARTDACRLLVRSPALRPGDELLDEVAAGLELLKEYPKAPPVIGGDFGVYSCNDFLMG